MTLKQRAEFRALGGHLTEYPVDKTFDEVLAMIEAGSTEVIIWEKYEWEQRDVLVELIRDAAVENFKDYEEIVEETKKYV